MAKIKVRVSASRKVYYEQIVLMDEAEFLKQTEDGDLAANQDLAGDYIDPRNICDEDQWEDIELFRFQPTLPAEQAREGGG